MIVHLVFMARRLLHYSYSSMSTWRWRYETTVFKNEFKSLLSLKTDPSCHTKHLFSLAVLCDTSVNSALELKLCYM